MDNQFNYSILPCGLKQSSIKEIVDSYNNLSGETRQYEDLIFVRNNTIIDETIEPDKFHFGVIKTLINSIEATQEFQLSSFSVPIASQTFNNGLSLFTKIQSASGNIYCDFAVFKFK